MSLSVMTETRTPDLARSAGTTSSRLRAVTTTSETSVADPAGVAAIAGVAASKAMAVAASHSVLFIDPPGPSKSRLGRTCR